LANKRLPEHPVVMGRVSAPFGIKGWMKIQPYTESPDSLLAYTMWWLGGADVWLPCTVEQAKVQGPFVVARLAGCETRDDAMQFRGKDVAVERDSFPHPAPGEYYQADLIGLKVINEEAQALGDVVNVIGTGANDVLVVQQGARERLIPFIESAVKNVDLVAQVIRVEWGADY